LRVLSCVLEKEKRAKRAAERLEITIMCPSANLFPQYSFGIGLSTRSTGSKPSHVKGIKYADKMDSIMGVVQNSGPIMKMILSYLQIASGLR
jgi:hypothetical protein